MCAAGEATEGGRGAREGPPQPPQPLSPPSCADVPSTQDDASTPLGDTVEQIVCHEGLVSLPVVLNIVTPTFCPYCSNHDRYPYARIRTCRICGHRLDFCTRGCCHSVFSITWARHARMPQVFDLADDPRPPSESGLHEALRLLARVFLEGGDRAIERYFAVRGVTRIQRGATGRDVRPLGVRGRTAADTEYT